MVDIIDRRCPRCAETKLVAEFGARSNGKYQPYCKPCMKDACAEWKAKHPGRSKTYSRKSRAKSIDQGFVPKRKPGRPALTGDETEAKCSSCLLVMPLSEFYGTRTSRSTYCKPCARDKTLERYYALRDKNNE